MKRLVLSSFFGVVLLGAIAIAATAAVAHNDNGKGKARLDSYQEAPLTLSTTGTGSFRIRVRSDGLHYKLSYRDLSSNATQAHIHFGRTGIAGGIIAWLCGTAGFPGPAGTPVCPPTGGTVEGVIEMADIIGPAGQGIAPGELAEVIKALRKGAVYANVHTATFGGGEIRGQIGHNDNGDRRDHKKR
jgi:hypothetical protein